MSKKTTHKRQRLFALPTLVICLASALTGLFLSHIDFFDNLELYFLNKRFELRGTEDVGDDIIIVSVDDTSIADLPYRYPWPRSLYGRAISNLKSAGAKLVVFDVEFTEASNPAEDLLFAEAVRKAGNVILAGKTINITGNVSGVGLLPPIDPLAAAAKAWGLVDSYSDSDGFVRRYAFQRTVNGKPYYSLGIETLAAIYGSPRLSKNNGHSTFRIGRKEIPTYGDNFFLINYGGGPHSFKYFSFSSILDDATFDLKGDRDLDIFDLWKQENVFRNKIVFVGVSLAEEHDVVLTPFYKGRGGTKSFMPGVEMHANAVRTVLKDNFVRTPWGGKGLPFLPLYLAVSLLTVFLTMKITKPVYGLFVFIGLLGMLGGGSLLLFTKKMMWINVMAPGISIFAANISTIVQMFVEEQKDKRFIKSAFQHYLPKAVMVELFKNPELIALGGEEREITILFSDVAGFTNIAESMNPHELGARLNDYLSRMTDIVFEHDGILDKYLGDAIMAEFGAPIASNDHALKGCMCALKMQRVLGEMRKEWEREGKVQFFARVGINTGRAIVGNMGSSVLFDYTAIGDSVNLASRLEGASKEYGTQLIISESTWRMVSGDVRVRELDRIRVKGKTEQIKVYELLGMKDDDLGPEKTAAIKLYEKGFELYHARKWKEASAFFIQALETVPTDGPSKTYLTRCYEFTHDPPPESWDGIFEFHVK